MSIRNYNFAKWYGCGNEDRLDTWDPDYYPEPSPVLDREKELAAKREHESYPCITRMATEEELEEAFKDV